MQSIRKQHEQTLDSVTRANSSHPAASSGRSHSEEPTRQAVLAKQKMEKRKETDRAGHHPHHLSILRLLRERGLSADLKIKSRAIKTGNN